MNFDTILDRLSDLRRRPGGFMARCPAHDDRVQSLSVGLGDNDTPLLHCHAGCSYHEVIAALSEEAGSLTMARGVSGGHRGLLPPPSSESAKRPASLDGFQEIYDYEDENGNLLFKVCRTHDKRFFQCHPDPESPTGFYWGLNGVRRIPYRLPRVREAVEAAQTVYIVEGEKDVHAIERAGGVATCNPMGASKGKSKWRDEWGTHFIGADVVVVPDMDEAGMKHALTVQKALAEYAHDVAIRIPRAGKDAYDHLKAGYGLGDFF